MCNPLQIVSTVFNSINLKSIQSTPIIMRCFRLVIMNTWVYEHRDTHVHRFENETELQDSLVLAVSMLIIMGGDCISHKIKVALANNFLDHIPFIKAVQRI